MNPQHPFHYVLTSRFKPRVIKSLLNGESNGKLLDIGCGSGHMLHRLSQNYQDSTGIDMCKEAILFGQSFVNSPMFPGNAEALPFSDSTFDTIISTDTFEHIPNDKAAMREAFRVLKNKGCLIIYTPCKIGLLSNTKWVDLYHNDQNDLMFDQRYYTFKSLSKIAKDAGFRVEYLGYHNIFFQELCTQFLKWISSRLNKQYHHQADILGFTKSKLFPLYRWILLPIIHTCVRLEEFIFETFFRAKVPGHRIVIKCRKTS